jgi:hypothetical protein
MSVISGNIGQYKDILTQSYAPNLNVRNIGSSVYLNRSGRQINPDTKSPRVKYVKTATRQMFEQSKARNYAENFACDFFHEKANLEKNQQRLDAIGNAFNNGELVDTSRNDAPKTLIPSPPQNFTDFNTTPVHMTVNSPTGSFMSDVVMSGAPIMTTPKTPRSPDEDGNKPKKKRRVYTLPNVPTKENKKIQSVVKKLQNQKEKNEFEEANTPMVPAPVIKPTVVKKSPQKETITTLNNVKKRKGSVIPGGAVKKRLSPGVSVLGKRKRGVSVKETKPVKKQKKIDTKITPGGKTLRRLKKVSYTE